MKVELEHYNRFARDLGSQSTDVCLWCRSPFHSVYRLGLCRHCYWIRSEQRRLQSKIEEANVSNWKSVPLKLRLSYQVAVVMERWEKADALLFGENEPVHTGTTLETLLNYIGVHLAHMSSQRSSIFSRLLSPDQRTALIYLLSEPIRKHKRRHRRQLASKHVIDKDLASTPPDWMKMMKMRKAER